MPATVESGTTLVSSSADRPRIALRVALVNMPFASARYPSIQLGLMHAVLQRRGFSVVTHYFNMRLAARIGWDIYELICHDRAHLLGEWLFARAAFGECAPDATLFLTEFREDLERVCARLGTDLDFLVRLREVVIPAFLQECLDDTAWQEIDVVGFGSVFEQNCAALALARLIKSRYPRIITVFGGSNFEDEMGLEYVRALPWIDYAVIGEGDEVFPALLERLAAGDQVLNMPGVARRTADGRVEFGGRAPMVRDLDALPEPEYADFFSAAAATAMPGDVRGMPVMLPFETARGCWWGAKHHCTFCGLNGAGMTYRSKSPARTLAGIDELAARYHVYAFEAVDNILDHRYIQDVFVPIAEQRKDYTFFYEVKANLTQPQLKTLAKGGVRHLQPGIESLSTPILKLMRKGTTGIQNVRFLKWAQYYGMRVSWNILYGFPGETPEDYAVQLATMRQITHLQPPSGAGRIWLERYSPYFIDAEALGITDVRPEASYRCVYPADIDHKQIAYFFDYEAGNTLPVEQHADATAHIAAWRNAWKTSRPPYLVSQRGAERLTVIDGRDPAAPVAHVFNEHAAQIYEFCGPTYHGLTPIVAHLRDERGMDTDADAVQRDLAGFFALGLMLVENEHYLSLALPGNPNW